MMDVLIFVYSGVFICKVTDLRLVKCEAGENEEVERLVYFYNQCAIHLVAKFKSWKHLRHPFYFYFLGGGGFGFYIFFIYYLLIGEYF